METLEILYFDANSIDHHGSVSFLSVAKHVPGQIGLYWPSGSIGFCLSVDLFYELTEMRFMSKFTY